MATLERTRQGAQLEDDDRSAQTSYDLGPAPLPPSFPNLSSTSSAPPSTQSTTPSPPTVTLSAPQASTSAEGSIAQDVATTSSPSPQVHSPGLGLPRLEATSSTVSEESLVALNAAKHAFLNALVDLLLPTEKADTLAHLRKLRRQSIASFSQQPDIDDTTYHRAVVNALRQASNRPDSSALPASSTSSSDRADDLRASVLILSASLSSADAEMTRSLSSILGCIDRLTYLCKTAPSSSAVSRTPSRQGVSTSAEATTGDSDDLYVVLKKEAKALQAAGTSATDLSEVENAERDLLWSRMRDLLDDVVVGCARRSRDSGGSGSQRWMREPSVDGDGDHLPPEYCYGTPEIPPLYAEDSKHSLHDDEKTARLSFDSVAQPSSSGPLLRTGSATNLSALEEKMQLDFDRVTAAIDRLYQTAPQLSNQRAAEPDRRKRREEQLTALGNAIERLSRGRLQDQRANPLDTAIVKSTMLQRQEVPAEQALDELLEKLDKAAARNMSNQRATVSAKQENALREARRTARHVAESLGIGPEEAAFREHLLERNGVGRLEKQDATFFPGRSAGSTSGASTPGATDVADPFEGGRPRSSSNPSSEKSVRKRFSFARFRKSTDVATPPPSSPSPNAAWLSTFKRPDLRNTLDEPRSSIDSTAASIRSVPLSRQPTKEGALVHVV